MVRKHYSWTRARQTRSRPKTPAPKHGWLLSELVQLTGVPASTVRYYVAKKLLRPIELRGTLTRYDRRELLRLLAFKRLRGAIGMTLADKKRKLDTLGNSELEQWLLSGPLPDAALEALGLHPRPVAAASPVAATQTGGDADETDRGGARASASGDRRESSSGSDDAAARALDVGRAVVERWQRIALLPGLDLLVHDDAKAPAMHAAQRIIDEYVVK